MAQSRLLDIVEVVFLAATSAKYINDALNKIRKGSEADFLRPLSVVFNKAELMILDEMERVVSSTLNLDMTGDERFSLERAYELVVKMRSLSTAILKGMEED